MVCGDRQRVCQIRPDFCDSSARGGGWLRLFQLQRLAILGDSFLKSFQPAISEAKLIMNIGQFRLEFRRATGMISGLSVPFLLETPLRHHDVRLPRISVLGEIVLPKRLFVTINFRPAGSVCAHCPNQQRDKGRGCKFRRALSLVPRVCDTCAEKREQRNVCKVLEMISNERAAAHISHSNQSQHWEKRDNETGDRKKSAACLAVPPMPESSQNADERDQRQPFKNEGRIESPVWVNRHQSDRGEEMGGVPPYRYSGVHEAARERPDNNLFFTDAAALKPERYQAQNNRKQEKWR